MAKLTDLLLKKYPSLKQILPDKKITQTFLNEHTQEIISDLSENEIVEFTGNVYDCTAQQYDRDSHTRGIPESLPTFVTSIPEEGIILDLGCGHGRDSVYIIENGRKVVPYDASQKFIDITKEKLGQNNPQVPTSFVGDFTRPKTKKLISLTKDSPEKFLKILRDEPVETFDGIWACTSLLIHTPLSRLDSAINYWGQTLKQGGLFAVSYFNPHRTGFKKGYSLRASTTGEIKIFVSPSSKQVHTAFNNAGLTLLENTVNDYTDAPKKIQKKMFFINETYKKIK